MSIRFSSLTPETLPAVQDLLLPFWQRRWRGDLAERIFRWRFLEPPRRECIVALDGDRCVAMIDSWLRTYIVGEETVDVREMADWYSVPGYRGLGLQPMWTMMRKPEPIVSIGGSSTTQSLLPRLKWQVAQPAHDYLLRLSSGVLLEGPIKRLHARYQKALLRLVHGMSIPIARVRRHAPPSPAASVETASAADLPADLVPPRSDYCIARLIDRAELRWLQSAPREMGEFSALVFLLDGRAVAVSLSRLYSGDYQRAGYILHVQATQKSVPLYAWIVSETAAHLARGGAQAITCRTTCLDLASALEQNAFFKYRELPSRWWSPNRALPEGNALLSLLLADNGLLPYPA
jgi:hypothetical protein